MGFEIFVVIIIFTVSLFILFWSMMPHGKELNIEFRLGEKAKPKDTTSLFLKYSRELTSAMFRHYFSINPPPLI